MARLHVLFSGKYSTVFSFSNMEVGMRSTYLIRLKMKWYPKLCYEKALKLFFLSFVCGLFKQFIPIELK